MATVQSGLAPVRRTLVGAAVARVVVLVVGMEAGEFRAELVFPGFEFGRVRGGGLF